jgi:hypothetical protein
VLSLFAQESHIQSLESGAKSHLNKMRHKTAGAVREPVGVKALLEVTLPRRIGNGWSEPVKSAWKIVSLLFSGEQGGIPALIILADDGSESL